MYKLITFLSLNKISFFLVLTIKAYRQVQNDQFRKCILSLLIYRIIGNMLSYLSNRHYHILTKQFPEELKIDQPNVVYLPAHNGEKNVPSNSKKVAAKTKIKRSKRLGQTTSIGDCCPICFSLDNISVEYYGKKHVCVKCRKLMRDQLGNQTRIFLNESGEIICLGLKVMDKIEEKITKFYYYTDYTRLQINGRSAFATFANPDEMVVILRNSQSQ